MKPHHTSCWVLYWNSVVHIMSLHVFMAVETLKKRYLFQLSQVYKCLSMMISEQFLCFDKRSRWRRTAHLIWTFVNVSVSPQSMKTWLLWEFRLAARRWGSVGYEDVLWLDLCSCRLKGFSGRMVKRVCVRVCSCAWSNCVIKISLDLRRGSYESVAPFRNQKIRNEPTGCFYCHHLVPDSHFFLSFHCFVVLVS